MASTQSTPFNSRAIDILWPLHAAAAPSRSSPKTCMATGVALAVAAAARLARSALQRLSLGKTGQALPGLSVIEQAQVPDAGRVLGAHRETVGASLLPPSPRGHLLAIHECPELRGTQVSSQSRSTTARVVVGARSAAAGHQLSQMTRTHSFAPAGLFGRGDAVPKPDCTTALSNRVKAWPGDQPRPDRAHDLCGPCPT